VLATAIATAVNNALNNAQSAAGAVATAVTAVIKGLILLNCLLSTKSFCVGFVNYTQQCDKFLLNVSRIILEAAVSFVTNDF